jgi:hypothetical protein
VSCKTIGRLKPVDISPSLPELYQEVRQQTEAICVPLETEDYTIHVMPDIGLTKWNPAV